MTEPRYRHVQAATDQGVLVLTVTTPKLQGDELIDAVSEDIFAAVDRDGARKVALDLSHLTYTTSAGLRALLALRRHLNEKGGRVVLCGLGEMVADVLNTTRLISTSGSSSALFEAEPDVPAAVALLNR
jgi:anti-anti-sigma factor